MKLGVFTCLLGNLPLEEALGYFKSKGLEMVEIGCGGYPGNSHADPDTLLAYSSALSTFKSTVADSGLEISALSCHGNPIHPNKAIAADFDRTIKNTILLAEKLGIHQINTFSGCPGDSEIRNIPTGSSAPGRMTSPRYSSGSGTRFSFPIGQRPSPSPRSTALTR